MAVTKVGRANTSGGKRARRVVSVTVNGRELRLSRAVYADRRRGVVRMLAHDPATGAITTRHVDALGRIRRIELRGKVVVRFARS